MKILGSLGLAAALFFTAGPLLAQTTGRIEGRILDSTGAVLTGTLVTVTSSSLQGPRTETTDNQGRFRFHGLAPGVYTVMAERQNFKTVEQTARVSLDTTVTLDFQMGPAISEVLTVIAETPIIDLAGTTVGASFDADWIETLPVARTYQGLAYNVPSVVDGGLNEDNPSIGGASAAENRYLVDGLDTTDPAFGTLGTSLPFEFIQEIEVKTGGYPAEYGGALGGVLNVVTKSGGNAFHGDAFAYLTSDALQAEPPPTEIYGRDLGFTKHDFGGDLGGPILQDKLWFFAAVNPTYRSEDFTNRQELPFTTTRDGLLYSGKLTWKINPQHQLRASVFGDPSTTEDDAGYLRNSAGLILQNHEDGAFNFNVTYTALLGSNAFLDVSAGRSSLRETSSPERDVPIYVDEAGGRFAAAAGCGDPSLVETSDVLFAPGCVGGNLVTETRDRHRDEARAALAWSTATGRIAHEVKLGANFRWVQYESLVHYPSAFKDPFYDAAGALVDGQGLVGQRWLLFDPYSLLIEFDQNSQGETDEAALFVHDQLHISDRLTLNLGLRFDSSESRGSKSDEFPDRQLDFGLGDMIAPRLGVVFDLAGNGSSKLYGHYGRFYESIPLDINVRAFGNEQFNFYFFDYPSDGSLPDANNPGTLLDTFLVGTGVGVSEGIKPQFSDEYLAGFDYQLAPSLSFGVRGIYRTVGDVIEDISVDGGATYFVTNPGGTFTANPVTGESLPEPVVFPRATRTYKAMELLVNKVAGSRWQLSASYVLSQNKGNYGGLFRQDNEQLDPNFTSLFDLPELLKGAEGLLPNDRTHQFKAYGSYRWPFKLVTGFFLQALSGTPLSKLGAHPTYGNRERFITDRGSEGRTPAFLNLDLHAEYPIRLAGKADLRFIADVFNVTNRQAAGLLDQEWTFEPLEETVDPNECGGADPNCPAGNPNYGKPLAYQGPFSLRLGVKLTW